MPYKDDHRAYMREYKSARRKARPALDARACLNCDASFVPPRRDAIFCGARCRSIAEWVRYARRKSAEGTIDRPDIWEAVQSVLSVLIRGHYDKRGERAVPTEVRDEPRVIKRCQNCKRRFTPDGDRRFTVQHIRTESGFRLEAWCYRCNMDQARSVVMKLSDEEAAFVDSCFKRARAVKPMRVCDDEVGWASKWRSYAAAGVVLRVRARGTSHTTSAERDMPNKGRLTFLFVLELPFLRGR